MELLEIIKYKNKKMMRGRMILSGILIFGVCLFVVGIGTESSQAVTTNVTVSLGVTATITITCTDGAVTMGSIAGTGQSTLTNNYEDCTVKTNNSTGYNLGLLSSTVTMNSGSDTIASYTPTAAGVPEVWSVAGAASEWGYHIGSTSTSVNTTTWGTADSYGVGKWLNTTTSNVVAVNRVTETSGTGDVERVYFGAEVGATAFQPSGTYTNVVTLTALTNP